MSQGTGSQATGRKKLSGRDIGIIVGVIICLGIAAAVIYRTWWSYQPHVVMKINSPPGSALKLQAMKAQQEMQAGKAANSKPGVPGIR